VLTDDRHDCRAVRSEMDHRQGQYNGLEMRCGTLPNHIPSESQISILNRNTECQKASSGLEIQLISAGSLWAANSKFTCVKRW
jgi:hypothetical protein